MRAVFLSLAVASGGLLSSSGARACVWFLLPQGTGSRFIGFSGCDWRALGTWALAVVAQKLISCGSWALESAGFSSCGARAQLLCGT